MNSARKNANVNAYLQWLRKQVEPHLTSRTRKRLQSFNTVLCERLYLELLGMTEHIVITDVQRFPIIKIIGKSDDIEAVKEQIAEIFNKE